MIIIQSKPHPELRTSRFEFIEPFIEAIIAHESIHVVIRKLENEKVSDSLDDIEVIVNHKGRRFQVTLNNMLFATDKSGLVIP